jgi:hypothetical protein
MCTPHVGIPEADWPANSASVRMEIIRQKEIQVLRQDNDELHCQLSALATELASLRDRIRRNSRNPPSRPQVTALGSNHRSVARQ